MNDNKKELLKEKVDLLKRIRSMGTDYIIDNEKYICIRNENFCDLLSFYQSEFKILLSEEVDHIISEVKLDLELKEYEKRINEKLKTLKPPQEEIIKMLEDEIMMPISPKGISTGHLILLRNESVVPNSAIEKLNQNLKTLEEKLNVTNSKISDEPIVFNITIDHLEDKNNGKEVFEEIVKNLRKLGVKTL